MRPSAFVVASLIGGSAVLYLMAMPVAACVLLLAGATVALIAIAAAPLDGGERHGL